MIRVLIGELLDSDAQTLVNTVNCVGVMGKGIALQFKRRFPDMFQDYQVRCKQKQVKLGYPYLYKPMFPPWILNFPTKDHWRSVSRLEDIISGLDYLVAHYREWGITSMALPPLGCGQGKLEWRAVGPTIYRYLSRLDIPIEMYAPQNTPSAELELEFLSRNPGQANSKELNLIRPAWVALVEILRLIESHPYHWPIGRTVFQKIAFIATREGLPTGLSYNRGSYGPFSPEVKNMVTQLVNSGLVREEVLGRMFAVKTGPAFNEAQRAYHEELKNWEPILRKTANLFMRMDTKQAEVAATVIFAAGELENARRCPPSECEVLDSVMQWKQRRNPPMDKEEVASTIRNLAAMNWLKVRYCDDLPASEEI